MRVAKSLGLDASLDTIYVSLGMLPIDLIFLSTGLYFLIILKQTFEDLSSSIKWLLVP